MPLLTVNVGSSSVRLVAYDARDRVVDQRHLERQAAKQPLGAAVSEGSEQAARVLHELAEQPAVAPVEAVVHRIVHGGERFTATTRIDAGAERAIDALAELAPLHNPPALAWLRAARAAFPHVPQFAVFDTAFFARLPAVASHYALPALSTAAGGQGLRRYGFHGLAHGYMAQRWQELSPPGAGNRVVSLQLGSGCSMAAIRDGAPLDTSMGFSPLEGLVMATRCGDVDPGLLLYLQRSLGWPVERLEQWLNQDCGLLGVSGESADVRALLESTSESAALALELFCYRARKYVGAYLAVLGGADAILFGGGIGEHAAPLRARILQGLEWAGVVLDAGRNVEALGREMRISSAESRIDVRVIPVDESRVLASEARTALARA